MEGLVVTVFHRKELFYRVVLRYTYVDICRLVGSLTYWWHVQLLYNTGGGVALLHASKELDNIQTANFDQKIGVQIIQNALKVCLLRYTLVWVGWIM